ncbi:MAG: DUF3108 domain-containing protein [Rubrivivax sp.]|nr:DUF3108 domain-containing protein [Rubrivivax sp.]
MRGPRRSAAAWGIAILVLVGHLLLIEMLQDQLRPVQLGAGSALETARLQVQFVRILQPRTPPPVAALPIPRSRPPRAAWLPLPGLPPLAPMAAASAPDQETAPAATATQAQAADDLPADGSGTHDGPADAQALARVDPPAGPASAPAAATSGPAAFEWPPSTRLRYALTGNYRGPIEGSAQVEWLRQGDRYQVFLDVLIGVPFAPLITRQMRSEGQVAADGLHPRLFEERTRLLWRDPRVFRIDFEPTAVRLPGNRRVWRPAGVQDAVSQFVQLTWRFTTDPSQLSTGHVLVVPLALPSHVGTWIYDVGMAQTLYTPAGPVDAVHVRPRRQARAGGDLVAEMWFAPSLQYLPVRILIRQDAQTYVDLLVDRLPEQAASIGTDTETSTETRADEHRSPDPD